MIGRQSRVGSSAAMGLHNYGAILAILSYTRHDEEPYRQKL